MKDAGRYVRTDLASEYNVKDTATINNIDKYGIKYNVDERKYVSCEKIIIDSDVGEKIIGKPKGTYITLSFNKLWLCDDPEINEIIGEISKELRKLIIEKGLQNKSVLICGLGNRFITSDAIGPLSADGIVVTRHLKDSELFGKICACEVSVICPGVVGQTGIETLEIIKGAAEHANPDYIIAIDALAARSTERLATTVQICDTGINPGSGIGNSRVAINSDNLNIPVIALGVPTVVDSATLVYDVLDKAGIEEADSSIKKILETGQSFFLSLKESDIAVKQLSHVISEAVNRTLSADN